MHYEDCALNVKHRRRNHTHRLWGSAINSPSGKTTHKWKQKHWKHVWGRSCFYEVMYTHIYTHSRIYSDNLWYIFSPRNCEGQTRLVTDPERRRELTMTFLWQCLHKWKKEVGVSVGKKKDEDNGLLSETSYSHR